MELIGLLPYLFILFITLAVAIFGKRSRMLIYLYSLLLSIFTGFTGEVSPDRYRYALAYLNEYYIYEPMFNAISRFLHVFSLDERFLFWTFSLSTFIILLSFKILENSGIVRAMIFVLRNLGQLINQNME